jgi:ATP-dependent exoDNAse (exonuclease V) beta subunit
MLQRLDFGAPPEVWGDTCRSTAAGYHLAVTPADLEEVCRAVTGFAASPAGRELARCRLRRELPFLLRLDGAAQYHLKGAMDLVAEDDDTVTVLDYKFAGHGGDGTEGYRFQVACYMLVLAAAFPGKRVRGALAFLGEGTLLPVEADLPVVREELLTMMDEIRGRREELSFPTLPGCNGSRCPFRDRCSPPPTTA